MRANKPKPHGAALCCVSRPWRSHMGSPNQLSFLPDDYLERKAARRTNAICAVLFLLVIGGLGSPFTISEMVTKLIDKEYNKIEERYVSQVNRIEKGGQEHRQVSS